MIKLFREKRINETYNLPVSNMVKSVKRIDEHRILNTDTDTLTDEIFKSFKRNHLEIDFSDREVNVKMVDLPAGYFPRSYDVRRGKTYPCAKANYTFTVKSGEMDLLAVQPNQNQFMANVDASINGNNFTIGYQTHYGNIELSEEIKKEIKNTMAKTIEQMESTVIGINQDLDVYNSEMKRMIRENIEKRKVDIEKKNSQNDDLNDF